MGFERAAVSKRPLSRATSQSNAAEVMGITSALPRATSLPATGGQTRRESLSPRKLYSYWLLCYFEIRYNYGIKPRKYAVELEI